MTDGVKRCLVCGSLPVWKQYSPKGGYLECRTDNDIAHYICVPGSNLGKALVEWNKALEEKRKKEGK